MRRHITTWVVIAVIVITSAPYIYAAVVGPPGYVFNGTLLNPLDGASYLAKMRQGWQGSWTFTLPYTPGVSKPESIFLYYLFLGHLARWTGLELILVYHFARLGGAVFLVISLASLIRSTIPDPGKSNFALVFTVFGAGLGWLAYPWLGMTSDFWIAEAYPILSAYINPHFPLGLAILVWLFTGQRQDINIRRKAPRLFLGAGLLSIIYPFAIVVLLVVQAVLALWETIDTRRLAWKKLFFLSLGGLPYLIYQYYVIISNPILSLWNVQNQTPSPPAWDLLISFSPALILAVPGAYFVIRKGYTPGRILLAWLLVAFVLLFLPFNLQRRFMTGLFIPVALVSVLGWISLSSSAFIKARAGLLLMTLSLPTILLVLMAGLSGAAARDQRLFRTTSEAGMMAWMADHLSPEEIVLAAPDTGNLIPAWSGQEVVYGHPFETVNADAQKALVEEALRGNISLAEFNSWLESPATYLFWSRREQQYSPSPPAGLAVMHQVGDVSLLKIP